MSSEVYVAFALDWTGPEIIDVVKTEEEADALVKKYAPYVMFEKQTLPENWPFIMAVPYMEWFYLDIFLNGMPVTQ